MVHALLLESQPHGVDELSQVRFTSSIFFHLALEAFIRSLIVLYRLWHHFIGTESLLLITDLHDDGGSRILPCSSCIDHIAHDLGCYFVRLRLLLVLIHLGSQLSQLRQRRLLPLAFL